MLRVYTSFFHFKHPLCMLIFLVNFVLCKFNLDIYVLCLNIWKNMKSGISKWIMLSAASLLLVVWACLLINASFVIHEEIGCLSCPCLNWLFKILWHQNMRTLLVQISRAFSSLKYIVAVFFPTLTYPLILLMDAQVRKYSMSFLVFLVIIFLLP